MRVETKPPVHVGILGAGFISESHIRALLSIPDVRIAAVCDEDSNRAQALQKHWHVLQFYDSLERMLSNVSLDVVHVLTPPFAHTRCARACLEAGSHVFIEKPLA